MGKLVIDLTPEMEERLRDLACQQGIGVGDLVQGALEALAAPQEAQTRTPKRPERMKLTAEESLKRMDEFPKRKEQFIASVRKGKNRDLPSGSA